VRGGKALLRWVTLSTPTSGLFVALGRRRG
jgi:hypothetical protein